MESVPVRGVDTGCDGLLYLCYIKLYIYPQALELRLKTIVILTNLKLSDCGSYKKYLAKVQYYCSIIGKEGVKENGMKLAILEQLKNIPDIRKIRETVQDIKAVIMTDVIKAAKWDCMSIANKLLLLINNNKQEWNEQVDQSEPMAMAATVLTYGKLLYGNTL